MPVQIQSFMHRAHMPPRHLLQLWPRIMHIWRPYIQIQHPVKAVGPSVYARHFLPLFLPLYREHTRAYTNDTWRSDNCPGNFGDAATAGVAAAAAEYMAPATTGFDPLAVIGIVSGIG